MIVCQKARKTYFNSNEGSCHQIIHHCYQAEKLIRSHQGSIKPSKMIAVRTWIRCAKRICSVTNRLERNMALSFKIDKRKNKMMKMVETFST